MFFSQNISGRQRDQHGLSQIRESANLEQLLGQVWSVIKSPALGILVFVFSDAKQVRSHYGR